MSVLETKQLDFKEYLIYEKDFLKQYFGNIHGSFSM